MGLSMEILMIGPGNMGMRSSRALVEQGIARDYWGDRNSDLGLRRVEIEQGYKRAAKTPGVMSFVARNNGRETIGRVELVMPGGDWGPIDYYPGVEVVDEGTPGEYLGVENIEGPSVLSGSEPELGWAHLANIYVLQEYRGCGVAGALIERALGYAFDELGLSAVLGFTGNKQALRVILACGGVVMPEARVWATGYSDILGEGGGDCLGVLARESMLGLETWDAGNRFSQRWWKEVFGNRDGVLGWAVKEGIRYDLGPTQLLGVVSERVGLDDAHRVAMRIASMGSDYPWISIVQPNFDVVGDSPVWAHRLTRKGWVVNEGKGGLVWPFVFRKGG